jgi:hypothetical protein
MSAWVGVVNVTMTIGLTYAVIKGCVIDLKLNNQAFYRIFNLMALLLLLTQFKLNM